MKRKSRVEIFHGAVPAYRAMGLYFIAAQAAIHSSLGIAVRAAEGGETFARNVDTGITHSAMQYVEACSYICVVQFRHA